MEIGRWIQAITLCAMVLPALAARIPQLRPYARRIWIIFGIAYLVLVPALILLKFVILPASD